MGIKQFFSKLIRASFFNAKWRCLICGKEIFDDGYICDDCEKILPYNDGAICGHCGRKVIAYEEYCSTCKNFLVSLDACRSVFNYEPPISALIKNLKYDNRQYIAKYFAKSLAMLYFKSYFNADMLVYVPMSEKAKRNRGFNQSEMLAKEVSMIINVPTVDCLIKKRETKRQATLKKAERLKNLKDSFSLTDKKVVKDKTIVIVDDVTTTGATAQTIAEKLKKAGAIKVYLLTIASTPPIDKY